MVCLQPSFRRVTTVAMVRNRTTRARCPFFPVWLILKMLHEVLMTAWGVSPTQTVAMDNTHHFDFHWSSYLKQCYHISGKWRVYVKTLYWWTHCLQWLKALKGTVDIVLTRSRRWSGSGSKATARYKEVVHCKHVSIPNVNLVWNKHWKLL